MPILKKQNRSSVDINYEHLGKMLVNIYETGYIDRNQAYKMSFIKGLLSGLGGVVGATLVLALILWFVSLLGNLPFLERISDNVTQTLNNAKP